MKLARVEQLFDGSRLIFYYTAEGRVDFRELVRDLAAHFRMRIEMRQIGVRDEAAHARRLRLRAAGRSAARPGCRPFEPISIKMAKQQNLSLNPSKLSGMCGRLKCCLRYELPNGEGRRPRRLRRRGRVRHLRQPDRTGAAAAAARAAAAAAAAVRLVPWSVMFIRPGAGARLAARAEHWAL